MQLWSRWTKPPRGTHLSFRPVVRVLEDRTLPSFIAPTTYPAGADPYAVGAADLTGNGRTDLVVANYYNWPASSTISVLMANGDGSFQAPKTYPRGTLPNSLAVADLTGNGIPDVVVTNTYSNMVTVLLGNGDGSFRDFASYPVASPASVAVANVYGDGHPDIVLVTGTTVSVLRGNGDGSFQDPVSYPAGASPKALAVGDFNGDGHPDLAVANSNNTVDILLNKGDGSFGTPQEYGTVSYPTSLVVAELTGDGTADLVIAGTNSNRVGVLLGNGDGSFRSGGTFAVGTGPQFVTTADLNGDGHTDVITANPNTGTVSALLGNGDGSFQPYQDYVTGGAPQGMAVADFDGDGIPDLAVTNGTAATVAILRGQGDGSFGAPRSVTANTGLMVEGDFNGDGIPDLAVASPSTPYVDILLGRGDGTFQPPVVYDAGNWLNSLAVGDVNGDGNVDLVVTGNVNRYGGAPRVSVLLGRGDGTFAPAITYVTGLYKSHAALADLTGDGNLDLVIVGTTSYTGGPGVLSIMMGNGDGTFQAAQTSALGSTATPTAALVEDINGDGIPDLVTTTGSANTVSVRLGNGDGTFQTAQYATVGPSPSAVAVGDFNGDGVPDLAVANRANNTVRVLLGNGDGSFVAAADYAVGIGPNSLAVGDFNADGYTDLAVGANTVSGTVSVLLNAADWDGAPPALRSKSGPISLGAPSIPFAAQGPQGALPSSRAAGDVRFEPVSAATMNVPRSHHRTIPEARLQPADRQVWDAAFEEWSDPVGDALA